MQIALLVQPRLYDGVPNGIMRPWWRWTTPKLYEHYAPTPPLRYCTIQLVLWWLMIPRTLVCFGWTKSWLLLLEARLSIILWVDSGLTSLTANDSPSMNFLNHALGGFRFEFFNQRLGTQLFLGWTQSDLSPLTIALVQQWTVSSMLWVDSDLSRNE